MRTVWDAQHVPSGRHEEVAIMEGNVRTELLGRVNRNGPVEDGKFGALVGQGVDGAGLLDMFTLCESSDINHSITHVDTAATLHVGRFLNVIYI